MNDETSQMVITVTADFRKQVDKKFLEWLGVEDFVQAQTFSRYLQERGFVVETEFGQPVFVYSDSTPGGHFIYSVEQDVKFSIRKVGE